MNKFHIEGMSCGHCVKSVKEYFSDKGISSEVSLEEKWVNLEKDIDKADFETFAKELLEDGYTLTNIEL